VESMTLLFSGNVDYQMLDANDLIRWFTGHAYYIASLRMSVRQAIPLVQAMLTKQRASAVISNDRRRVCVQDCQSRIRFRKETHKASGTIFGTWTICHKHLLIVALGYRWDRAFPIRFSILLPWRCGSASCLRHNLQIFIQSPSHIP